MNEEKDDGFKMQDLVDTVPIHKRKYVVLGCLTILIISVVVLGFAYGSARVCSQVDGVLDGSFVCHPNYNAQFKPVDPNGLYIGIDTYNNNPEFYNVEPNTNKK